jgi:hypothetical protein
MEKSCVINAIMSIRKEIVMEREQIINEILKMIQEENPKTKQKIIDKIQKRLNKSSDNSLLNTYDMFKRFGVNNILDAMK